MRWQRLGVAVLPAAAGIAGVWVVTDAQDGGQAVGVDAPASQPADARPTGIPAGLSIDDMMQQLTDAMARRTFCEAPPVELTEEQKQLVEKMQSTLPPPPTVPGDTPSSVTISTGASCRADDGARWSFGEPPRCPFVDRSRTCRRND